MRLITYADSGNIIVVLLTIAWIIYSIYKKAKKGRVTEVSDNEVETIEQTQEPVTSWLEKAILGDEFAEKKERSLPMTFAEEIRSSKKNQSSEPEPFLNVEMQLYRGGEYADLGKIPELRAIENQDSGVQSEGTYTANVDLKTAIIYSAILNRPRY